MKYRKKPVVVEARQWDGTVSGATPVIDWVLSNGGTARFSCAQSDSGRGCGDKPHTIAIDPLERSMHADPSDWIIRDINGEFYPCKPEMFETTYESVGGAS